MSRNTRLRPNVKLPMRPGVDLVVHLCDERFGVQHLTGEGKHRSSSHRTGRHAVGGLVRFSPLGVLAQFEILPLTWTGPRVITADDDAAQLSILVRHSAE